MSILEKVIALTESIPSGERDNWEEYFMAQAFMVSLRSTCGSRRVGAVIVNSMESGKRNLVSTGYNGYPPGAVHCVDGGCPRFEAKKQGLLESGSYSDDYPCEAFHAEANALYSMQKRGISTEGCVLFTTASPCRACAEKILGAGISKVYYCQGYPDDYTFDYFYRYGVEIVKVEQNNLSN